MLSVWTACDALQRWRIFLESRSTWGQQGFEMCVHSKLRGARWIRQMWWVRCLGKLECRTQALHRHWSGTVPCSCFWEKWPKDKLPFLVIKVPKIFVKIRVGDQDFLILWFEIFSQLWLAGAQQRQFPLGHPWTDRILCNQDVLVS